MKKKYTYFKYQILFGICFISLCATSLSAEQTDNVLACVSQENKLTIPLALSSSLAPSCQINAFSAYKTLNRDKKALLVDIRSTLKYQKVSIPNSINVPLYALKSKNFLKSKKLLLIDDGGNQTQVGQLCYQLKQYGFDIAYIQGGLNAWTKINHKMNGSPRDILKIDELKAEHFNFLSLPDDVLVINIGDQANKIIIEQERVSPLFQYLHLPIQLSIQNSQDGQKKFISQLKQLIEKNPKIARLFIYDNDGKLFSRLKKQLKKSLKPSVFYMTGGYNAFKRYKSYRMAMLDRKQKKSNPFFGCKG